MRSLTRFSLFLVGILLVSWIVRAALFRAVVSYHIVGSRSAVASLDPNTNAPKDIEGFVDEVLGTTAEWLHFSVGPVSNDPVKLVPGSPANCIGYAALFSALLKGYLQRSGLDDHYSVEPVIAKLYVGGLDLHSSFNSPFWKDHDIVRIKNLKDGSFLYVDPTLFDATGIRRVRGVAK